MWWALPAAIAGSAVAGGAISSASQAAANETNIKIAAQNRRFQERMSSTAYQRAVKDLQAAGLNPALAYSQGGSSSPQGSTTHVEPTNQALGNAVSSAGGYAATVTAQKAQIAQTAAVTAKTAAEARQINIESALRVAALKATVGLTSARGAREKLGVEFDRRSMTDRLGQEQARAQVLKETELTLGQDRFQRKTDFGVRLAQLKQQLRLTTAQAKQLELLLPQLQNVSDVQDTWFMRNVMPYINSALGISRIAAPVINK